MDWSKPLPLNLDDPGSSLNRLKAFFSHLDARVFLTPSAFIDVGGGSWSAISQIKLTPEGVSGKLGDIGRFCEFAEGSAIHVGGEHLNNSPINVEFNSTGVLGALARMHCPPLPWSPISVGDNVVVSRNAIILSGVRIDDGAVIGAGSVVTRPVSPFVVVAGVPARPLRSRLPAQDVKVALATRWWDFEPAYLAANIKDLAVLALRRDGHAYRRADQPRLVLRAAGPTLDLMGYMQDDHLVTVSDGLASFRDYCAQAMGAGPFYSKSDPWIS